MSEEQNADFHVGYKRPPRHTQFKPGQSGNPGGRPKKKHSTLFESVHKELHAKISVTEGGRFRKITKLEAIVKQFTLRAFKGDYKAGNLLLKILESEADHSDANLSPILQEMRAIHARHVATPADKDAQP